MSWISRFFGGETSQQGEVVKPSGLGNLDPNEEALAEEIADEIVSSMFERKNDPLSSAPCGEYDFIAVDVETATREASTICQIGLACVSGDRVDRFVTLIDPETSVEDRNFAVHQIDDEELNGQPIFPQAMIALRGLLERHHLVQHSTFDRSAFDGACDRYGLPRLSSQWGDSINAAKHAWPEMKGRGGYGLANLSDRLGINLFHHDAGEDAHACAQIVSMAMAETGKSLRDLTMTAPARRTNPSVSYNPPVTRDADASGPLNGNCAVFTGSLSISRNDAADMASRAGIRVVNTVSRKVTLLIVGDQDLSLLAGHKKSSKHRKAEELIAAGHPIRIIGEAEFISLVST